MGVRQLTKERRKKSLQLFQSNITSKNSFPVTVLFRHLPQSRTLVDRVPIFRSPDVDT